MRQSASSAARGLVWGSPTVKLWIIVGLLGFWVFSNSLSVPFWEDDFIYLTQDLQQALDRLCGHVERGTQTYWFYRPLVELTWSVEYLIWGKNPAGFRVTNILVHLANSVLVGLIVLRLLGQPLWLAIAASILFLLHPANQCTVVWLSNRFDLFYTFFYLLALFFFAKYSGRNGRLRHIIASTSFFALAMLSKENAITLPAVLLLYQMTLGRPKTRLQRLGPARIALGLAPFVAISVAALIRRVVAYGSEAFVHYQHLDSWLVAVNVLRHVKWSLLPFKELVLAQSVRVWLFPAVGLIFSLGAYFWLQRRKALFLLGFTVITALPILNQSGLRHLYLPLAGLIPLVIISVSSMIQYELDWAAERGAYRYGLVVAWCTAVLLCAGLLCTAFIPGHGKLIPSSICRWLTEVSWWLWLPVGLTFFGLKKPVPIGTDRLKLGPPVPSLSAPVLLPLLVAGCIFGVCTRAYNEQNTQWGKSVWKIYSELDRLSLPIKQDAEIYVFNAPSMSYITPIRFEYFPKRTIADAGLEGFYFRHRYGDKIDWSNLFFLRFKEDGRLVLCDALVDALASRFQLRQSPRFSPLRLAWIFKAETAASLEGFQPQPGSVHLHERGCSVTGLDTPVRLIDTLTLFFEPGASGANLAGSFCWDRGNGDGQSATDCVSFEGTVGPAGRLDVDLALWPEWILTRSILGFQVRYRCEERLRLVAVGLSSEKMKPKSRLIKITPPHGKSWLRNPIDVIRDLLTEAT